jgi:hypothetical protein
MDNVTEKFRKKEALENMFGLYVSLVAFFAHPIENFFNVEIFLFRLVESNVTVSD